MKLHAKRSKVAARRRPLHRDPALPVAFEPLEDRRLFSFTMPVDLDAGTGVGAVVVADFNADGLLDLAAPVADGFVSVLMGIGDGAFGSAMTSAIGAGARLAQTADINGDGRADLLTVNGGDNTVGVLLGNGDGTFQTPLALALPPQIAPAKPDLGPLPQSVVAAQMADLNGDGNFDLVATGRTNATWSVQYDYDDTRFYSVFYGHANVMLGNGDGTFTEPNVTALGDQELLLLGDMTGDGRVDLVTTRGYSLSVKPGNGDGTFGEAEGSFMAGAFFGGLSRSPADLNGDGRLDFLLDDGTANGAVVALGQSDGTFELGEFVYLSDAMHSDVVGDVNADGVPDIVVIRNDLEHSEYVDEYWSGGVLGTTRSARVLLGRGDGTFVQPADSFEFGAFSGDRSLRGAVLADFNGDGLPELVSSDFNHGTIVVAQNTGDWLPPASSPPTIRIDDVNVTEGDTGSTPAVFTVTLSNAWPEEVAVDYSVSTGHTADIIFASGTVRFAPGETSRTITIEIVGDLLHEALEAFNVVLANATPNATIADNTGYGTIEDNDPAPPIPPTITIDDVYGNEGNTGTTPFVFTVNLSNAYIAPVTVKYATANGTATAKNKDYVPTSGTLTFAPGETSRSVAVAVKGDRKGEPDEFFFVKLNNAINAEIVDGQGQATILNDETTVSINDVTQKETHAGLSQFVFMLTLSAGYDVPVTFSFATANGTATTKNRDYVAKRGTVTFAPGEVSKMIWISVSGDKKREPNESFFVKLSGATNSVLSRSRAIATVLNDDLI